MTAQTSPESVLQQFVERAQSLYTLPAAAAEVLELTERPRVDVRAMKECVERDPALTARLLRVVNSSLFGLSREVTDLNQAITLLGVKPLKLLVLGFSLPPGLFRDVEAAVLGRYWRYTLVKAVAGRKLAEAFWDRPGDEPFVAGLLQEIGILILVHELGDPYVEFLQAAVQQGDDLTALECETLGFSHTALSACLLEHWCLPPVLVEAIAQPQSVEELVALEPDRQSLPQILHVASLIASIIVDGRADTAMAQLLTAADRYRRISIDQLDALLDDLQAQVELMADVFCVRTDSRERYRDILARAHARLAQLTDDVLPALLGGAAPKHDGSNATIPTELETTLAGYRKRVGRADDPVVSAPSIAGDGDRRSALAAVRRASANTLATVEPVCDPALLTRLTEAINVCRLQQSELSFALLEIEDYDQLLTLLGPERLITAVRSVERIILALAPDDALAVLVTDSRLALILPDVDRRQAVELARNLLAQIPKWSRDRLNLMVPLRCSAAVVTASVLGPNYPGAKFLEAAERCLFAAQMSGGGLVKSINIY